MAPEISPEDMNKALFLNLVQRGDLAQPGHILIAAVGELLFERLLALAVVLGILAPV